MVYKLGGPEAKEMRKHVLALALRYGVVAALTAAVVGVLMDVGMLLLVVVSLSAAAACVGLVYGYLMKGFNVMVGQGDWFVTVTEAGLMIEKPKVEVSSYMSWAQMERAVLKNKQLFIVLKNGMTHFLPLASLSPERVQELASFCAKHAGIVVPPEKQVAPPAGMLTAPAFPCADGVSARLEIADEMARQRAHYVWWIRLVFLACLMGGLVILVWAWVVTGESNALPVVFSLAFAFLCIRSILHPGWVMRKWVYQDARSFAYIHQGKILVDTPGVAWSQVPVSLVSGARECRYAYAYAVSGGGVLGISRTVPAPSELPRPVPVRPWKTWLALAVSTLLVPALVALGMACWLSLPEDTVEDEGGEQGCALVAYVQEFLPPRDFPGAIYWSTILDQEDGTRMLLVLWENGMELKMPLPEEAPVAPVAESDTSE